MHVAKSMGHWRWNADHPGTMTSGHSTQLEGRQHIRVDESDGDSFNED